MKKMKIAALAGMLGLGTALSGCSDIPMNYLETRKGYGGEVSYTDGPAFTWTGLGSKNVVWDGRRIIDLPLDRGSQQSQFYETKDGYLRIDTNIYYKVGKDKDSRDKWFVRMTDADNQFALAVEGLVRSTVKEYQDDEVLNADLAKANGKLPYYEQIALNLQQADFPEKYGIDRTQFAVWPGNISPLEKSVMADLERQRKVLLDGARDTAQSYIERAQKTKAKVDGEYTSFISDLSEEQSKYFKMLDMTNAIKSVARAQGQDVDITLYMD